jgi:hypothetical protein
MSRQIGYNVGECRGVLVTPSARTFNLYGRSNIMRQYTPNATIPLHCSLKVWERFSSKISISKTGCWMWTAFINPNGYGYFTVKRKGINSHRFAYTALRGCIPSGLEIDHTCRNRGCCNPAHMELVTHRENIRRSSGPIAENASKTHCLRGHAFTKENTRIHSDGGRSCKICAKINRTLLKQNREVTGKQ